MSYLPCELHCHTVHSDGDFTVGELLKNAKDDHLTLIALTDHNTTSGCDELDDSIVPAIRGIEWTTYFGHMLVLGADKFIDWRNATPDNIDDKLDEIKNANGIVGIAHPYQIGSPVCTGGRWEFNIKDWSKVDYMEIWHQDMDAINSENVRAVALWTSLLDKGYKIAATYGKDWHRNDTKGHYGCTYIGFEDEVTPEQAIENIKNGKTVVSTGAKFFFRVHRHGKTSYIGDTVKSGTYTFSFFTDLHSREKNAGEQSVIYKTIKIISNGGRTVLETKYDEKHTRLRLEKNCWYRAELWGTIDGEPEPLAITSPIYCK